MKLAPVTVTQLAVIGGVCIVGYMAYRAYSSLQSVSISGALSQATDYAIEKSAAAVDTRKPDQNPNELSLGGIQQAVSNAVQRGQDAGATNFLSAYLIGIFK